MGILLEGLLLLGVCLGLRIVRYLGGWGSGRGLLMSIQVGCLPPRGGLGGWGRGRGLGEGRLPWGGLGGGQERGGGLGEEMGGTSVGGGT